MLKYDISKHRYRRRFTVKKAIFKFSVVVFIFVAIVGFFYLPKFRLKNIIVQGNSFESARDKIELSLLKKIFWILPSDNFFLFSKKSAAKEFLKDFPAIKTANFVRRFPNTLLVNFEPRKKIARWCYLGLSDVSFPTLSEVKRPTERISNCYFIDEEGIAFEKTFFAENQTETSLKFIIEGAEKDYKDFELGNYVMEKEILTSFLEFAKDVENSFQLETEKIIIKDNGYRIYFKEGWFVILDNETDFKNAFENLKLVLLNQIKEKRAELEYIDLRFSNKVFFKIYK